MSRVYQGLVVDFKLVTRGRQASETGNSDETVVGVGDTDRERQPPDPHVVLKLNR